MCDTCAICLGDLSDEHTTRLSGCGHTFHSSCVVVALQHNRACPLCRYQPDMDESSDDESEVSHVDVRRRRRIQSTLMRARHGSASQAVQQVARRYRSLAEALRSAQSSFRTVNRDSQAQFRRCRLEVNKVVQSYRRRTQPLHRRWEVCRRRLEEVQEERRELGNVLEAEAPIL